MFLTGGNSLLLLPLLSFSLLRGVNFMRFPLSLSLSVSDSVFLFLSLTGLIPLTGGSKSVSLEERRGGKGAELATPLSLSLLTVSSHATINEWMGKK